MPCHFTCQRIAFYRVLVSSGVHHFFMMNPFLVTSHVSALHFIAPLCHPVSITVFPDIKPCLVHLMSIFVLHHVLSCFIMFHPLCAVVVVHFCRAAGCRKGAACTVGGLNTFKELKRLLDDPASWIDLPCKACKTLLESCAFDPDMALQAISGRMPGQDNDQVQGEDGNDHDIEVPECQQANGGAEGDPNQVLTFDALVRSISAHFEDWVDDVVSQEAGTQKNFLKSKLR